MGQLARKVSLISSVVLALVILAGCMPRGVPVPNAPKGSLYFFPKVGVVVKSDFAINQTDDTETQAQYQKKAIVLLKKSGYFLDVGEQKRNTMILITYHQYQLHFFQSLLEEALVGWIPFSNVKKEVAYILTIKVQQNGKTIEQYRYEKNFEETRRRIITLGDRFFEASMKRFLKKLAIQSKMKKIEIVSAQGA